MSCHGGSSGPTENNSPECRRLEMQLKAALDGRVSPTAAKAVLVYLTFVSVRLPHGPSATRLLTLPVASLMKVASYNTNILLKYFVSDSGRSTIVAAPGSSPSRFQRRSFSFVIVIANFGSDVLWYLPT